MDEYDTENLPLSTQAAEASPEESLRASYDQTCHGENLNPGKRKVFLIVTIPTHVRLLLGVADLLRASGRYDPVMVYYPSAVYDQNHANCQTAPYDAFVWTQFAFKPATPQGLSTLPSTLSASPEMPRSLARYLPNRGVYRRLVELVPCLPPPATLLAKVRQTLASSVRLACNLHSILRTTVHSVSNRRSSESSELGADGSINRTILQKAFLHSFSHDWASLKAHEVFTDGGFLHRLKRMSKEGLFVGLSEQKSYYLGLIALIRSEEPALIILPEENLFYNSHLSVLAAHLNSVPVVVVPYTIVNTLEWAEAFYNVPSFRADRGWNRLLAAAFPHWVLTHRNRRLILPASYILACEHFGLVPDNPWLINSGASDAIAAEGPFMASYYQRAGIRKDKVYVTGALADDELHALLSKRPEHRQALSNRLGLPFQERVVLIGLPPDQFGAGKRDGCEFDTYDSLIRFMVETAVTAGNDHATILINLHPRIQPETVAWLEALGATIVPEPIERLVPLADIYVSVASATIRLAITSGIPVINFDAYRYDYDDYKGLEGVCEINLKQSYQEVIERMIRDESFYEERQSAQINASRNATLLDGQAGARMLTLFDQLIMPPAKCTTKHL